MTEADFDRIEQACEEGHSSFHGGGIHPGYAGDLLPLTLARISSRVDRIHLHEVVNFAGQHHRWTAWCDGAPLITFHAKYTMGDEDIEPASNFGDSHYLLVIEGDPPTELVLRAGRGPDGHPAYLGYTWTAVAAVNAIPAVCAADPGALGHLDLGLVRLPGVARPNPARTN